MNFRSEVLTERLARTRKHRDAALRKSASNQREIVKLRAAASAFGLVLFGCATKKEQSRMHEQLDAYLSKLNAVAATRIRGKLAGKKRITYKEVA